MQIDSDLNHPRKPDVFPLNRYMEYVRGIIISDTLIQNDHHSHNVSFREFIDKYSDFPIPEMVFLYKKNMYLNDHIFYTVLEKMGGQKIYGQ